MAMAASQGRPAKGIPTAKTRKSEGPGSRIIRDQTHGSLGNEHHLVGEAVGLQQGLPCSVAQPLQFGSLRSKPALYRDW
jgi:hypothetical protein